MALIFYRCNLEKFGCFRIQNFDCHSGNYRE